MSVASSLVECLQIWFVSNLMATNKSDYPIWHITARNSFSHDIH